MPLREMRQLRLIQMNCEALNLQIHSVQDKHEV